jgi:hypothetical protein
MSDNADQAFAVRCSPLIATVIRLDYFETLSPRTGLERSIRPQTPHAASRNIDRFVCPLNLYLRPPQAGRGPTS